MYYYIYIHKHTHYVFIFMLMFTSFFINIRKISDKLQRKYIYCTTRSHTESIIWTDTSQHIWNMQWNIYCTSVYTTLFFVFLSTSSPSIFRIITFAFSYFYIHPEIIKYSKLDFQYVYLAPRTCYFNQLWNPAYTPVFNYLSAPYTFTDRKLLFIWCILVKTYYHLTSSLPLQ